VNPNRDRDEPEMLEVPEMLAMLEVLEMLEMLERHGSQTGTVLASSPGPTVFRSGALPVNGLELVVRKRRLCGDLSPESALAILQKNPARRGLDPRPDPCHHLNFRPLRWHEIPRTPLPEGSRELHRSPVSVQKLLMP